MRIALDTNVLVYAAGVEQHSGDSWKVDRARDLLRRLVDHDVVIPLQVLGEYHRVLVRKDAQSPEQAADAVHRVLACFPAVATTEDAFRSALDLSAGHRLPTWDAIILAVAAEAGCHLLLSEDYRTGFAWNGVTIANPFAGALHPALGDLVSRSSPI